MMGLQVFDQYFGLVIALEVKTDVGKYNQVVILVSILDCFIIKSCLGH